MAYLVENTTKRNTKQEILEVALELFSIKGYEATSMNEIAEKVGIRKASLYAHYNSKYDILDCLLNFIDKQYKEQSIFFSFDKNVIYNDPNEIAKIVRKHVKYIVNDPHVSKIRRLFVIEQFRNKRLSDYQQAYSYDNVIKYGIDLVDHLIESNVLRKGDIDMMASEFVLPISMWIGICDRDSSKQDEIMELIEKHVLHFYETYKK